MVRLSASGAVMTLCEWFAFEILNFSTSYVGTAHLAAQTFLSSTSVLIWHIPFSTSIAVSTRMGQVIGNGAVNTAKQATRIYAIIFVFIGLLDMGLLVLIIRELVVRFFIQDEEVSALVQRATLSVAIFQVFDAITCGAHAIIRGLGWQTIAGWVTFGVNYIYAVPLALVLELGPLQLGLPGLWMALGSGLLLTSAIEAVIIKYRDWNRAVEDARRRDEVVSVE
jgi:MATE family, multidrug and toxin extrusion protein